MPFTFRRLAVRDVVLVESRAFPDPRGFFMEHYKESEFAKSGIADRFVQDNYSHSTRGVVRGLHFQKRPRAQSKLVTVISGEIFDVAVDVRKNSPTYGGWAGEILSGDNRRSLYVPEGFAHGFCVLSDEADVVYKVSREYSPEHERGIIWNDPDVSVKWPVDDPKLSDRDRDLPKLDAADSNFTFG